MADSQTQTEEISREGKELKYLDFVYLATIKAAVLLAGLYQFAKDNSGPLKPGVRRVEGSVNTVVGPVYDKYRGVPFEVLKFADRKVGEILTEVDRHVPKVLKSASNQAYTAAQKAPDVARSLAGEVQRSGVMATAAGVARDLYGRYEPVAKEVYIEEEEVTQQRGRRLPDTEACGERELRGVQWVFMGSPGAQRRMYATRVAELLDVPYISMGSLVRQELSPNSSLYKKIVNSVNEGKLVPEEIIFGLLSKRLEEGYQRGESGFILDGIPRTRIQAEIMDQMTDIDLVVNLKYADHCLVTKHFRPNICSHCGKSFDVSNPESTSFNPCLATRTRHVLLKSSAAEDMKDNSMEKYHVYSEQIELLEEYYRNQKKLLDVQVTGGPGETWQGLLAALRLQHMDAATSPQKLTV